LECDDQGAEKVRNIAKNSDYGVVEFNEVDCNQLLVPCFYYRIVIAAVINVDVM
jgi:hypothetical protein